MDKNLPPPAANIVDSLGLRRVYEGVYLKRVYESAALSGARRAVTSAYVLAARVAPSRLHRLDCDELWHFYAGQPLHIYTFGQDGVRSQVLGVNVARGENPLVAIPRGVIFGAAVAGFNDWCLFGCTCAPGFQPEGCEFFAAGSPALASFTGHAELIRHLTFGGA
ncbi:MAG: cupin domain-containing protein [Acidaminococcales bacterium]|jgi:predicted cupin superfamily sugar epimerase|nr:cupin domain-containing protein [Acidaminococcales bacterium]